MASKARFGWRGLGIMRRGIPATIWEELLVFKKLKLVSNLKNFKPLDLELINDLESDTRHQQLQSRVDTRPCCTKLWQIKSRALMLTSGSASREMAKRGAP